MTFLKIVCLSMVLIGYVESCYEYEEIKTYKTLQEFRDNEPEETPAEQILMNNEASTNGAACLDGSVPDFYYRAGFDDGISKFNFYLQGGGWCASLDQCAERTGSDLGSSKYDQKYLNIGSPYLSSNRSINPLSYNWNTVFIRYCDGSSYSSNNDTIYKYNSSISLHFRGWRILNGVLNVLRNKYNLGNASDVLLTGCSAGALGVFFHADYFYDKILEFTNNKKVKYMAMPDAGYFMEVNHYITMMEFNFDYGNLTIGLNQDCVSYYESHNMNIIECMYALNIAPFIKSKMFSMQSQYDSNQIKNMNTNDAVKINQYGQNLTYWYLDRYINTSSKHFGWLVSCYHHCTSTGVWDGISIEGYTTSDAQINAWFDNATYSNLLFQNQAYPCSSCC